jgi:hypothetical protein
MVQPYGLRAVKGVHSLGCASCGGEIWWIGTVVGVEPGFLVVECREWIAKMTSPPCGLRASPHEWLVVERK